MSQDPPPAASRTRRAFAWLMALGVPAVLMFFASRLLDPPVEDRAHPSRHLRAAALVVRDRSRDPLDTMDWLALTARFLQTYRKTRFLVVDGYRRHGEDYRVTFQRDLRALARSGEAVDLYLMSRNGSSWIDLVEAMPEREQLHEKLRFVYDNRHGSDLNALAWHEMGAKLCVAHPFLEDDSRARVIPRFHVPFLRRFLAGYPLEEAVLAANQLARSAGPHTEAYLWTAYEWGGDFALTRAVR